MYSHTHSHCADRRERHAAPLQQHLHQRQAHCLHQNGGALHNNAGGHKLDLAGRGSDNAGDDEYCVRGRRVSCFIASGACAAAGERQTATGSWQRVGALSQQLLRSRHAPRFKSSRHEGCSVPTTQPTAYTTSGIWAWDHVRVCVLCACVVRMLCVFCVLSQEPVTLAWCTHMQSKHGLVVGTWRALPRHLCTARPTLSIWMNDTER